jgi:hypothetical protein
MTIRVSDLTALISGAASHSSITALDRDVGGQEQIPESYNFTTVTKKTAKPMILRPLSR